MIKYLVIIGFMLVSGQLRSQHIVDTTVVLKDVNVSSEKIRENTTGQKVIRMDSVFFRNHEGSALSDLLAKASGIQVKSYNSGGLSSISFRGTSSQHTGIFWHGFNLNQINSGMIDLSLIPVSGFDRVEVVPGGNSSLFGSGNMGGSIHLVSEPSFDKRKVFKAVAGTGSFGEYNSVFSGRISDEKWFSRTLLNYSHAKNNFDYKDFMGVRRKLENGAWERNGIMQDLYRKFNNSLLGIAMWYTAASREIPPSMVEAPREIDQYDRSFRAMLNFRLSLKRNGDQIEIRSGFFDEIFKYSEHNLEGIRLIDTRIITYRSMTEAVMKIVRGNTSIKPGLTLSGEFGESTSWGGNVSRTRMGAFLLLTQNLPAIDWKASLNIRQELDNGSAIPLTPEVGMEGAILKSLTGKLKVSRNYRIPTFNELYWVPGGNPDLKPEDSWNGEISLLFNPGRQSGNFRFNASLTLYSSQVKNWVLWVPVSTWSEPRNLQYVWSRGIETEMNAAFISKRMIRAGLNGGYTYARSTPEKNYLTTHASLHKQLIYVPEHRIFAQVYIQLRQLTLGYNHRFNGQVYTTSDNLETLPGFHTGEFNISNTFNFRKSKWRLQADVRNVWNEEYQVVENYPNPGRSFYLTLSYEFSHY